VAIFWFIWLAVGVLAEAFTNFGAGDTFSEVLRESDPFATEIVKAVIGYLSIHVREL
jgi:hypothetical protein